jgi:hypothetical protein
VDSRDAQQFSQLLAGALLTWLSSEHEDRPGEHPVDPLQHPELTLRGCDRLRSLGDRLRRTFRGA